MKIYIMFYIHNYFFNCCTLHICTLYVFNIHYWMDWLLHRLLLGIIIVAQMQ